MGSRQNKAGNNIPNQKIQHRRAGLKMAEVKWIKVTTDVFDDEKILLIECLPEADSIIVIWFKLLCLAGKQNNSGVFIMGNRIPYTDKMLATIFRRKEATVQLALQTFEQFGMIEIIDGVITIPNWGKHQNLDQLESKKEYMRNYMQEYRKKQKKLTGNSKLCETGLPMKEWIAVLEFFNHECAYCGSKEGLEQEHIIPIDKGGKYVIGNIVPACRSCNASKGAKDFKEWYSKSDAFNQERLEKITLYSCKTNINHLHKTNVSSVDKNKIRIDKDKEIEKEKEEIKEEKAQQIADLFNSLCPSFSKVKVLSDSMKEDIAESLLKFSEAEISTAFEKAEKSSFLKGGNERKWKASFDWLIKAENIAKILNGNYDNNEAKGNNHGMYTHSVDYEAIQRMEDAKPLVYARDNKEIREKAEALKLKIAEG